MPGWGDTGKKESRVSPEVLCNINQRTWQESMEGSIGKGLGWEMNVRFSQTKYLQQDSSWANGHNIFLLMGKSLLKN